MKNNNKLMFLVVFLLGFLYPGCSESHKPINPDNHFSFQGNGSVFDTHESLTQELINGMNEMSIILEGVNNDFSADIAISKIKILNNKMIKIQKKFEKLGPTTPEIDEKLRQQFEPQTTESVNRLTTVLMALMNEPYGLKIMEALNAVEEEGSHEHHNHDDHNHQH